MKFPREEDFINIYSIEQNKNFVQLRGDENPLQVILKALCSFSANFLLIVQLCSDLPMETRVIVL